MNDREIILDTETTGLNPFTGDRLVELGCVEVMDKIPTGRTFHAYINPERAVPDEAFQIHGLSTDFLKDQKKFYEVANEFLQFIDDAILVIHNAEFDIKFLNFELHQINLPQIEMSRVVDTLAIARRKYPGSPNSLDALCSRYRINNTKRTKHGALLDSELLAEVYLELSGGRQTAITFQQPSKSNPKIPAREYSVQRKRESPALIKDNELLDHNQMTQKFDVPAAWATYIEKG